MENRSPRSSSSGLARSIEDPQIAMAERIARWTDGAMLDPIAGFFIPGLGDVLGAAVGLYVVMVAVQKKMPAVVVARMLVNLGIDTAVGMVPVAGDLFDFAWRANQKNVELLRARHAGGRSRPADWLMVGGAALFFVAALAVPIVLLVLFFRAVF
jgi:hypothetical protein